MCAEIRLKTTCVRLFASIPLFSATNNHPLHQHGKSPLFCWWYATNDTNYHPRYPFMQTYRPGVQILSCFPFRAAVFFTMFPPRVKRMPSTIAYLHFFVVNRDNELVAPNKTWAIESSADRPAIISAPEVNDGNGNKRRERAGLVFVSKISWRGFSTEVAGSCNFVRGGGENFRICFFSVQILKWQSLK